MNIGIDAHIIGKNKGGSEVVLRKIIEKVPRLLPNYRFFLFLSNKFKKDNDPLNLPSNTTVVRWPVNHPVLQRIFFAPLYALFFKLDLFHVQRAIPFIRPCTTVVTIHDILPITDPQIHNGFNNRIVRFLTRFSARRASCIITGSKTVKKEILSACRIKSDHVRVCYYGIDLESFKPSTDRSSDMAFLKRKFSINNDYLLYFGPVVERKNIHLLIEAFNSWKSEHQNNAILIIAGIVRSQKYKYQIVKAVKRSPFKNHLLFLGKLESSDMHLLLRNARLFFAPSLGEGFDLPPIEAMASGVPVICSNIEVHNELFSDCAAFYKTDSSSELAKTIHELWNDKNRCLSIIQKATQRTKDFSWNSMAQGVADIYSSLTEKNAQ